MMEGLCNKSVRVGVEIRGLRGSRVRDPGTGRAAGAGAISQHAEAEAEAEAVGAM
ncbi:hypothetical protein BDZ91DRAFT_736284 [Kalaharituber pfeilii]|nr:hypothetical protein BDZ91DRAFT_736284 [Kalaharituber pfeilii]